MNYIFHFNLNSIAINFRVIHRFEASSLKVLLRLPCYDFFPVAILMLGVPLRTCVA